MKRGFRWRGSGDSDRDDKSSSASDSGSEDDGVSAQDSIKKKKKSVDFDALSRHGYKGGLSVLKVPPPREQEKEENWSWSKGSESKANDEESYEERERTRVIAQGEELLQVHDNKQKKNLSFQQKEKRKRDLGQTSRGKNYVEEEKRLLRENGIYSGFDS